MWQAQTLLVSFVHEVLAIGGGQFFNVHNNEQTPSDMYLGTKQEKAGCFEAVGNSQR